MEENWIDVWGIIEVLVCFGMVALFTIAAYLYDTIRQKGGIRWIIRRVLDRILSLEKLVYRTTSYMPALLKRVWQRESVEIQALLDKKAAGRKEAANV